MVSLFLSENFLIIGKKSNFSLPVSLFLWDNDLWVKKNSEGFLDLIKRSKDNMVRVVQIRVVGLIS